jgi:hypothetical protein
MIKTIRIRFYFSIYILIRENLPMDSGRAQDQLGRDKAKEEHKKIRVSGKPLPYLLATYRSMLTAKS